MRETQPIVADTNYGCRPAVQNEAAVRLREALVEFGRAGDRDIVISACRFGQRQIRLLIRLPAKEHIDADCRRLFGPRLRYPAILQCRAGTIPDKDLSLIHI